MTPRPNAPPPAYRKPFRLAVPALLALLAALAAGPAAAQTSITLVSNTGQADGGVGALENFDHAQAFTTGGHTAGYTLTGVDIDFGAVASATASYDVSIRTDDSGSPGALVGDLTSPATLVADALNAFTTTGIDLAAGTTYFVLVDSSTTDSNNLQNTVSDNEDSGGQSGWSIADGSVYRLRAITGSWTDFAQSKKIAIKGYANGGTTLSTDATLSALALEDFDGDAITLNETFASTLLTYTASVENRDTQIDVKPTLSDANATIEYLDGDGVELTDADLNLVGFQVDLDPGDNVIQVKVTAEDTTTMKTYMVTVTRAGTATTVPGAPTGLTATASGTSAIDLAWTAPSNDGGSAISGYRIEVSSDGGSSWISLVVDTDDTNTTYEDRFPVGTTRHYRVSAINSVGTGAASNVATLTVPGAPTSLTATASGTNTINLAWTAPSNDGGSAITGYWIEVSSDGGSSWISLVVDTDDTNTTYEDRQPAGTTRHYRVSAINSVGTGAASNVDDATTATATCLAPNLAGRMQIWTGTVTVGLLDLGGTPVAYGFGTGFGALDDTQFSVGMNGYTVDVAAVDVSTTTTPGRLAFSLTGALAAADSVGLTLHVCDAAFALADATFESTHYTYNWASAGLDWSWDTSRTLYLSVPSDTTLSTDATLSALALSGGTLAPTFVSTTETYTATVGNSVTATTVTATPTHSGATVAFKDGDDNALTNPVTLAVGDKVIRAVVTAEDTTTMKTYMVTVTRADTITTPPEIVPGGVQVTSMPATDDTYVLGETIAITVTFDKAVTVDTSGGTPRIQFRLGPPRTNKWAEYSSGSGGAALVFTYTVQASDMDDDGIWLPENYLRLQSGTISATADNTVDAILTYAEPGLQSGHKVNGSLTRNPRPAIVTDGVQVTSMPMATADTYGLDETIEITVTFDKAVTVDTSGGTPRIAFRVDGDLLRWAEYSSGSGGTALVFTYTVQAGDMDADGIRLGVNSIEPFGGTIRDATDTIVDATLTYADPGLQSGHKVDGSLTTADATLSALALSGVTLDPPFVSSTETYTATVVNGVTVTTVTATPTQSGATVAFKDGDDNALTNPVALAVGATVIKAVVTAQDGTTTKTYMVTVARAPKIVTVQVTSNPMATGDTYGRGETIEITVTFDNAVTVDTSGGTPRIAFHLDGGLRWAVYSSGSGDTALVFTYTVLADDRAVNGILLRGDQFDLFGGTIRAAPDNAVDATLTYADPGRQSGHKVDGSLTTADATLSALALSDVTLVPTFVSSTETYTATVGNSVMQTTVTATPTQSDATVAFKDGADNALTNPVTLAVGANVIKAVVTAQDGTTTKTYTVFIDVSDVDEPPTEPDAPTGLSATVSDQEVDLIWTAPASNGGATILRYEYEQDGSGTWTSTGGTATSYTVTGLTNGQTYTFRVRAVNRVGAGLATSSRSATPTSTVVAPDTPSSFSATPGNRQVMLSWVQPSGGAALTDYEYEQDGSGPWTSTGGTAPSHTVTGLTNGQSYTFRVRAVNSAGPSAASGSRTATPTTTEPEAPESLSFTPGDQQVTLRWRAPTNDGGEPITHYEYEQDGSGTWISTGGTATSHTVTGLNNGQTYMFRVRAVNALGNGAVVTLEATPSPSTRWRWRRVEAPAVSSGGAGGPDGDARGGSGAVGVEPPASDGGTPVLRYEYRLKDGRDEFGEWTPIPDSAPEEVNATGYTVEGLGNGTVYVFELRAVNLVDNGPNRRRWRR